MLPEILQLINLEQLSSILVYWLEAEATRAPSSSDQQKALGPAAAKPGALRDLLILKQVLPAELYLQLARSGVLGLHHMSFALRHRLTQIYALSLELAEPDACRQDKEWQNLRTKLGIDAEIREVFAEQHCLREINGYNVIWGFSALGVHVSLRAKGLCRAFDAFDLPFCMDKAEAIFCRQHQSERFWIENEAASRQAKMLAFYADTSHADIYSEADLQKMSQAYWQAIHSYQGSQNKSLAASLAQFDYTKIADLKAEGLLGLRRRFLRLSLLTHPDQGGQTEDFVRLQAHYQSLRLFLASEI